MEGRNMHLQLVQTCFYFECLLKPNFNYFNTEDYKVYSAEKRQELINSDIYETNTFLLIPQIERNEIVVRYLTE